MCCLNIPGLISESKRVSKLSKETLISLPLFAFPMPTIGAVGFFERIWNPMDLFTNKQLLFPVSLLSKLRGRIISLVLLRVMFKRQKFPLFREANLRSVRHDASIWWFPISVVSSGTNNTWR